MYTIYEKYIVGYFNDDNYQEKQSYPTCISNEYDFYDKAL